MRGNKVNSYDYGQVKEMFGVFRSDLCQSERELVEIWETNQTLPAIPTLLRVSNLGRVKTPQFLDWFENKASYPAGNPLSPKFLDAGDDDSEFRIIRERKQYFPQLDRNGQSSPSFVHLLVIPHVRKYNALSMHGKEDAEMLLRMKAKAINFFKEEENRRVVSNEIISSFESVVKTNYGDIEENEIARIRNELKQMSDVLINELGKPEDLEFYLHSFPKFSVGQLHLHVQLARDDMVNRRSGEKLELGDVVKFLSEDKE
jgi:hypothetical protein